MNELNVLAQLRRTLELSLNCESIARNLKELDFKNFSTNISEQINQLKTELNTLTYNALDDLESKYVVGEHNRTIAITGYRLGYYKIPTSSDVSCSLYSSLPFILAYNSGTFDYATSSGYYRSTTYPFTTNIMALMMSMSTNTTAVGAATVEKFIANSTAISGHKGMVGIMTCTNAFTSFYATNGKLTANFAGGNRVSNGKVINADGTELLSYQAYANSDTGARLITDYGWESIYMVSRELNDTMMYTKDITVRY